MDNLNVSAIDTSAFKNARMREDSKEDFATLCESIKKDGLLENVVVAKLPVDKIKNGHTHALLAGFRRTRAAKELGFVTIPALVVPWEQAAIVNAAENAQRLDLHWIERSAQAADLLASGAKPADAARALATSESTISHYKKIAKSPFFNAAVLGLKAGQPIPGYKFAQECVALPADQQEAAWKDEAKRLYDEAHAKPADGAKPEKPGPKFPALAGRKIHELLAALRREKAIAADPESYQLAIDSVAYCARKRKTAPVDVEVRKAGRKAKDAE